MVELRPFALKKENRNSLEGFYSSGALSWYWMVRFLRNFVCIYHNMYGQENDDCQILLQFATHGQVMSLRYFQIVILQRKFVCPETYLGTALTDFFETFSVCMDRRMMLVKCYCDQSTNIGVMALCFFSKSHLIEENYVCPETYLNVNGS